MCKIYIILVHKHSFPRLSTCRETLGSRLALGTRCGRSLELQRAGLRVGVVLALAFAQDDAQAQQHPNAAERVQPRRAELIARPARRQDDLTGRKRARQGTCQQGTCPSLFPNCL